MPDHHGTTNSGVSKVVERQMRNWELARTQAHHDAGHVKGPADQGVFDFVTIANDVGGGGGDLGHSLGERLGWPVFDREILSAMAADDEVRARMYRSMDERDLNWFEEMTRTFVHGDAHKDDYFHRLTETLLCLARKSHGVFVGRSSDLILPKTKGLRVKVICPYDQRVASFAKHTGTTPKDAAKQVDRIHGERAAFIRKHFQIDILEPTRFDLLINTATFKAEQAVELVLQAMRARGIAVPG